FALVPGLPFVPFIVGSLVLGTAAFNRWRSLQHEAEKAAQPEAAEKAEPANRMGDLLDLDDIHLEFAPDLVGMVLDPSTGIEARIVSMRRHVAESFGLILPEMRLTDNGALPPGTYVVRIQGVEQARDRLRPDRVLALQAGDITLLPPGEDVREPVYGAPARWVSADRREELALQGVTVVNASEVLATHLLEVE
ncbi:FHIPEP family type III secretion protein, partial [Rhodovulum sulfidophilum]|nr:FHIPEP family type III secretion protein [Rhodovulum sulfidophilum]